MGGFAFFDFDHTLLDADAGPLFGRHLFAHRHRSAGPTRLRRMAGQGVLWTRYLPFMSWMAAQTVLYTIGARRRSSIVRSAYRGLKGVHSETFEERLDAFVAEAVPPLLFPEMMEEIRMHQAAGRRCVVVTTGMEPLVERALQHLPGDVALIGCRLEVRRGRLTGRVAGPLYGVDKANILLAYCRASGVRLADCWAYSDHWSDVEMLQAVGHPVVVGARGRLRRHAQKRGWRMIDPAPRAPAMAAEA